MKDDRIFTTKNKDDGDWVLRFKRPNQEILSEAELIYRTTFSRAFRQGILTNAEVDKVLRERGIWDEKREKEAIEFQEFIISLEERLKDPSISNDQGKSICEEIVKKRSELIAHNNIYTQTADNTCETMASEDRNRFFCSKCIYDNKTGLRVYDGVDDFRNRLDEQAAVDSYRETVIATLEVLMGRELPSDLTSEYAENLWLNERGLVDEDATDEKAEVEEKPKLKKKKVAKKAKVKASS